MNSVSRTIAALTISLGAAAPGFAQYTTPGQKPTASPAAPPAPGANATIKGQRVYNPGGDWVGTVSGTTTNSYGQRLVAVMVERRVGMGSTTVLFPAGLLQSRDGGGFTTQLSSDQIKQLPKANATP